MSTTNLELHLENLDKAAVNAIRSAMGAIGLVSLVIGVAILLAPVKTAAAVAGFIAAYAALAGLVHLAIGAFSRKAGGWPRIGHVALGAAFLLAAVLAFANLRATAAALGTLIGIVFGLVWIFEGVVALLLIRDAASKGWTILHAIVSTLAGVALVTSPLWGAAVLWLVLGVSLLVIGVVQVVRAFRFGGR